MICVLMMMMPTAMRLTDNKWLGMGLEVKVSDNISQYRNGRTDVIHRRGASSVNTAGTWSVTETKYTDFAASAKYCV